MVADTIGLPLGDESLVNCGGGAERVYASRAVVALGNGFVWEAQVNVMPKLPVQMLVGMDIISDGRFQLNYEGNEYVFEFERK